MAIRAISITTDDQWRALCRVLDAQDWLHSDALADHRGRFEAHDTICARLETMVLRPRAT